MSDSPQRVIRCRCGWVLLTDLGGGCWRLALEQAGGVQIRRVHGQVRVTVQCRACGRRTQVDGTGDWLL